MFLLKKVISSWLNPLSLCLLLLLAGVVWLWRRKGGGAGRALVTLGLALLYLASLEPLLLRAVAPLETRYPPYTPAPGATVIWVVVLSGGFSDDPTLPPNNQLGNITLARLVEGIRVLRFHPEARLLLSGGRLGRSQSIAWTMGETAKLLGVAPERIALEEESRDTEEQAVAVKRLVREEPFVLVTSALHLPRSMSLFEKQGLSPLPAPAEHIDKRDQTTTLRDTLRKPLPSAETLHLWNAVAHEYLGSAWSRLRGRG